MLSKKFFKLKQTQKKVNNITAAKRWEKVKKKKINTQDVGHFLIQKLLISVHA